MAKQLGVTLVEILVAICLINGAILMCVGEAIHRQKIINVLHKKIQIWRLSENSLELRLGG